MKTVCRELILKVCGVASVSLSLVSLNVSQIASPCMISSKLQTYNTTQRQTYRHTDKHTRTVHIQTHTHTDTRTTNKTCVCYARNVWACWNTKMCRMSGINKRVHCRHIKGTQHTDTHIEMVEYITDCRRMIGRNHITIRWILHWLKFKFINLRWT